MLGIILQAVLGPAVLLGLMLLSHYTTPVESVRCNKKQGGWVAIAVAAVGAIAGSMSKKKEAKAGQKGTIAQMREEGFQQRSTSAYEAALSDYYAKKDKAEKRRALTEFRKFSTVQGHTPGYHDDFAADEAVMPDVNKYGQPPVNTSTGKTKNKSKGGLYGVLTGDWVGSKLFF